MAILAQSQRSASGAPQLPSVAVLVYARAQMKVAPRSFRIRPARSADVPGLHALEQASFSGDRLSLRQLRHHLGRGRSALLVAVDGAAVVGSVLVFYRRGIDIARLYSIAVANQARGRGLGLALLKAAESAARRQGSARMRLEVRQDNAAAIALYEGRGYRRFGAKAGYYEDGAAAWRYEKRL